MTQYDLGKVVGDKGDDGNGIASITKTGTSGLVDTYTITYDDNTTSTFTVTNGSDASVDIVTSFSSTTSDSKVPSEKLTKNKLDLKADLQHSHGNIGSAGRMSGYSKNVVTDASGYITTENKPTIPSDVSDLTDTNNTAFTPKSHTHTVSQVTDFPSLGAVATTDDYDDLINKPTIPSDLSDLSDLNSLLFSGSYTDLSNKPSIPSSSSDLSDGSDLIKKSNTSGLLKNDGTVDTTSYSTFSGSYSDLSNKPSIPSSSSDLSDGSSLVKTSNTSGLLKNDGTVDTTSYSTFSGSYSDLSNKPTYTATITSSNTGAYEIGSTNINGSDVSIYGVDKTGKIIGTNATLYTAIDTGYRYRIWLETSGGKLMPVNTSSSTSATANKSSYMNTRDFYLNGRIFYCNVNGTTNANATFDANTCYQQVDLTLGFSFNNTGSALSLTVNEPVYMIAEDRGNGMGRLTSPYFTQTLPSSADNKLYIYLGHSISETTIELSLNHPIYEYKGSSIRLFREYYTSSEIDSLIGSAITYINQ